MKNTVSRGILFYLLILLGTILGIACILICIVMFSPGTKIFGVSYFRNNSVLKIEEFNASEVDVNQSISQYIADGRIQTIEIKSDYAEIDIANTQAEKFFFTIDTNISGLSTAENPKDDNRFVYDYDYDAENKIFSIEVDGPDSFLYLSKTASITFNIPKTKGFASGNLNLITESGNITLANHTENNIVVANLTADIGDNGQLFVSKNFDISPEGKMTVEAKKGQIETLGTINASTVNIDAEGTKISLNEIVGDLSIDTKDSTIKIAKVNKKFYYSAESGVLQVGTIVGDFECSELVDISNIFVDKISGSAMLPKASASNVEIKHIEKDVLISTTTGTIKLGELNGDVNLVTESGAITCLIDSKKTCTVKIETKNGNIDARFRTINGISTIATTKGKIYFQYDNSQAFGLEYACEKNKPQISNAISSSSYENSGFFAIGYDPSTDVKNKITITNTEGRSEFENNLKTDYSVFN